MRPVLWILLAVITILFWGNSVFYDFVNWDDLYYVVKNPWVSQMNWHQLGTIFLPHSFVMGNYHPLTILTYWLDYQWMGLNPMVFHISNVVLHTFNTILVYFLLVRLGITKEISFLSALIFSIHPFQIETICWISARKDLLATFFALLFFLSYLVFFSKKIKLYQILFLLLLYIGCLLSKATLVVLPLILLIYHVLFESLGKNRFHAYVLIGVMMLLSLYIGLKAIEAQRWNALEGHISSVSIQSMSYAGMAVVKYMFKVLFPWSNHCFYPYPIYHKEYMLVWAIPLLLLGILFFKKRYNALFGILFFLISLIPVLQIKPVGQAWMADRYMYFPLIGVLFLFSNMIQSMIHFKLKYLMIAFYILFLGYISLRDQNQWSNSIKLWSHQVVCVPTSSLGFVNLGDALEQIDQKQKAYKHYQKAIALDNLAMAFLRKASLEPDSLAINTLWQCIKHHPKNAVAYNNLALRYKSKGALSEATQMLYKSIQLSPNYAEAYSNLANIKAFQGDLVSAKILYQKALSLDPENYIVQHNLDRLEKFMLRAK